jgi:hypothetical protein
VLPRRSAGGTNKKGLPNLAVPSEPRGYGVRGTPLISSYPQVYPANPDQASPPDAVKWIAAAANGSGGSEQMSYERLGDLAAADVILTYGVRDGSAEGSAQAMIDQPLFQNE